MTKSKQLTARAGLTIPKDVRTAAGWHPGMVMDIDVTPGGVLVSPHRLTCHFCGAIENVVQFYTMGICRECAQEIHHKAVCDHA